MRTSLGKGEGFHQDGRRLSDRKTELARGFALVACILAVDAPAAAAADWHVSPLGTAGGDGSEGRPWDLRTALDQPAAVQPGDTIWLDGGRYGNGGRTKFLSSLAGTPERAVVVRGRPGERVVVDGEISTLSDLPGSPPTKGSFTWFRDFEVTNSYDRRRTDSLYRRGGFDLHGMGHRLINMIVHDAGHPGIGFWNQGTADPESCGEIYGSLVWANGVYDTVNSPGTPSSPWIRGSGAYTQNDTGDVFLTDNLWFWNFTTGINAYGEGGKVRGYTVEGNIGFDDQSHDLWFATIPGGGIPNPIERLRVAGNCTYTSPDTKNRGGFQCGYKGNNEDAVIEDNTVVAGHNGTTGMLFLRSFRTQTVLRNTIVGPGVLADDQVGGAPQTSLWDSNAYHGGEGAAGRPFHFKDTLAGSDMTYTFQGWKAATGFDGRSAWSASYPTRNLVIVRPNRYEPGRAHIAVYNWEGARAVAVDVSGAGLASGDDYEVRDAQNYFAAPVATGSYDGGPIAIPMDHTSSSPISPIAGMAEIHHMTIAHTPAGFGAFVLLRGSRSLENSPPAVDAGPDRAFFLGAEVALAGRATDDGLPAGESLAYAWSVLSGPGTAQLGDPSSLDTTVDLPAVGTYVLRLSANDGQWPAADDLSITVRPRLAADRLEYWRGSALPRATRSGDPPAGSSARSRASGRSSRESWMRSGSMRGS